MKRRNFVKMGLAAGAAGLLGAKAQEPHHNPEPQENNRNLCLPDGLKPDWRITSPPVTPFKCPLFVPPVKRPVAKLEPPPVPATHQRYHEFSPRKFFEIHEQEFRWRYHCDPPYNLGSWSWGFDGSTPGPTYHARYGEPVLVRRYNDLPPGEARKVTFACPKTTTHLHNGHTASESDGYPMDFIAPGYYWDHHYANFPSGHDPREKLTTLWYHDHMMDFTASNVYAGLAGFYLLFDEQDTGDENDPSPSAWRLPSGKYDIPMMLNDILFDLKDGQAQVVFNKLNTDGILGDRYCVNRIIQPYLKVEARKYRFRILNGGPSRFYRVYLTSGARREPVPFTIITGDGNFLPAPVCAESIYLSVAQRVDVIVDFSSFKPGGHVYLENRLEQTNGRSPTGRLLDPGDQLMRFDVVERQGKDNSCVPARFRELPPVSAVKCRRVWQFDYRGGIWTINGRGADPDLSYVAAEIEAESGEIWTVRNEGKNWSHPMHSHFTEFLLLEVNGQKFDRSNVQSLDERDERHYKFETLPLPGAPSECFKWTGKPYSVFMGGPRRDVATLLPNDEIRIFMRWRDFHGRYVMHCHNVVHEDHAMMVRWDIVPGKPTGRDSRPPG